VDPCQGIEEEHVHVSDELSFLWRRPGLEEVERQAADPETVRIFLNGCFDLMHVGHFNALRQAKALFYKQGYKKVVMVAGIHSSSAITGQKGPPLMSDDERIAVLQATKWVDELVLYLPYVSMSVKMADALRVKYVCHGDDLPVVRGGSGMYSDVIDGGRFQLLKRTEGISTTQILQRLLLRAKSEASGDASAAEDGCAHNTINALGWILATTQRLGLFATPPDPWRAQRSLGDAARVVYIDGIFDLVHVGHVRTLERAAQLGDYLLVGLYSDETVRQRQGHSPILTLLERAMAVLSLRCVADVVFGAPWDINRDLLTTMNISVVAVGRRPSVEAPTVAPAAQKQYAVPRALGMLVEVDSGCDLTAEGLRQRFLERRGEFMERNATLLRKELDYVEGKSYVPEA